MNKKVQRRKKSGGCLGKIFVVTALAAVLALIVADQVFNLRSNIVYAAFQGNTSPLQIRLANGQWRLLSEVSQAEMEKALDRQTERDGLLWRTVSVRRQATTTTQSIVQALLPCEVCVFEFSPGKYRFATSFKEGFALTTASERLQAEDAVFAITANFRDPKGKPLGLVVHEGRERNRTFPAWTGYFFVKDGRPWFGPKSLFEETPGILEEASQGYPSIMKNHTVFSYVDVAPTKYFDGKKITYRALAGVRQSGAVVFVVSGHGGMMNVSEVSALAQKMNVQHATLLDGGRALQYSLIMNGMPYHFRAFNTQLDLQSKALERQQSPVFITVRDSPPQSVPPATAQR